MTDKDLDPRKRCPNCTTLLMHESLDPLEEYCIGPGCNYYRSEMANGEVKEEW